VILGGSHIDLEEGVIHVDFDGRRVEYAFGDLDEITLAYATTIHKSQGSEYPAVVMPLVTQHFRLLERNHLYTGVTRGKHLVVLIAQPKALWLAIRNLRAQQRLTHLAERLWPHPV
jgi:exodeoxyribonuclease V alpha subunit